MSYKLAQKTLQTNRNDMKTIKIEIKNRFTGKILFEYESVNNTIKITVLEAIKNSADLRYANLRYADLRYADLSYADLQKIKHLYQIIPEEGSFIAWKKLKNNCLAKIEIPAKAKRTCNLINRKCRASYVKTLDIIDVDGEQIKEMNGTHDQSLIYKIGRITRPDKYDNSMLNDCTNGIHFFITKQEAINW